MLTAKARLLAGTLFSTVATLAAVSAGHAQTADQGSTGQRPAAAPPAVEELVVTGSRIPRPNLEQPTPVATLNATALENAGTSSLGDALAQLPALASSGTVRANSDSGANLGGLSFPDLRGLGTSRTLTLVNGKRHVAGDAGDTAVDLNTIPVALVDRVEVVTGGASAIYGSDAVSGVINIILKDRFQGFEFGVLGGTPTNGHYGQNVSVYGTGGWDFMGGRGNVTLTGFADRQERVRGSNIKGLANWATIANPLNTGPNDGIPDRLFRPYVNSEYFSPYGAIAAYSLITGEISPVTLFNPAGQPVGVPPRTGTNNAIFGSFAADCAYCNNTEANYTMVPRLDRKGLASTLNFEITPNLTFKGDVKYVETRTRDTFSPSFTELEYVLDNDNAFITPAIRQIIDAHPDDLLIVSRENYDIGGRNDKTRRKTFRAVAELDGKADAGFADVAWQASFDFGRTRNAFHSTGGLIPGNFNAAIDSVVDPASGQIRCRKDVPSAWYPGYAPPDPSILTNETCVPFNLFGQQNSRAAIDYVSFEADRKHTIDQRVASATFNFDTGRFLNLPGGPVAFAGGVEWRREESRNINDALVQSGITETAPQPNATGGFEVREIFGEFDAPLVRDAPFAHRLSLNAAIRYADYSHAGGATAYKVGGVWAPVADLSFRSTYSKAVRAPNITEAFLPATAGFSQIFDPCDIQDINAKPNRPANCAALGVTFTNATNNSFPGVTSGNADLRPERAKTWTAGFVLQPRWTPGLALTVDYYNIQIDDAISFLNPQDAAEKCVDGPTLSTAYCNLIIRDPATKQITSYVSSFLNQAALKTAGYDIQLSYTHGVADWTSGWGPLSRLDGRLTGSVNANYIEKLRQYAFQDYPEQVDRQEGELGNPRWSFITSLSYQQGPMTFTWDSQYSSKVRRNKDLALERYDRPYVEAVWYQDFILRYALADIGRGTEVRLGVNNAFDKRIPVGIQGNTPNTAMYDILGRYVFAGVTAKF
jgi:outer membrane receptor protein involved in Fe transport